MSFSIDKQTLDELNLLGKFRQGSVYALFNKVKTTGGERLLNHMFNHPLTDITDINNRSGIFRYFQETSCSFPFDVQQVDIMREYLDGDAASGTLMNFGAALMKKALSSLTHDERHKKDIQGLHAVIHVLNGCHRFAASFTAPSPAFAGKLDAIRSLLEDNRLAGLRSIDIYQSIPLKKLADADHLLKRRLRNEMEQLLEFVYETDVYTCVAAVATAKNFSYANALPEKENLLEAEGLCHPCIDKAVGNTLTLQSNKNVLFLTGANMAGKSTLMKSIGINLYLAHMGFPVAADNMHFSLRNGMYSSINVADNINLGYSHFYAEVVRVKQAAEAVAGGKYLLLMFDELFKGTNVKDAYDGTLAVTQAFADYHKCLFVVSTHIIEVGEALRSHNNIRFVYMPTVMDGVHPRYTYQLQEGITEDRQGMMIIQNEGILEMLG